MKRSKGIPVFGIMDAKTGEYKRLVEAKGVKELRAHLLKDITFDEPATATVAKLAAGGMEVEKAGE